MTMDPIKVKNREGKPRTFSSRMVGAALLSAGVLGAVPSAAAASSSGYYYQGTTPGGIWRNGHLGTVDGNFGLTPNNGNRWVCIQIDIYSGSPADYSCGPNGYIGQLWPNGYSGPYGWPSTQIRNSLVTSRLSGFADWY